MKKIYTFFYLFIIIYISVEKTLLRSFLISVRSEKSLANVRNSIYNKKSIYVLMQACQYHIETWVTVYKYTDPVTLFFVPGYYSPISLLLILHSKRCIQINRMSTEFLRERKHINYTNSLSNLKYNQMYISIKTGSILDRKYRSL